MLQCAYVCYRKVSQAFKVVVERNSTHSYQFDNRSSNLFTTSVTFSLFCFLCLYETGNFDIIIKKSSFIFLPYDMFDPPLVYCCSFFSRMVNKMVDFCYEKVNVACRFSFENTKKEKKRLRVL